MVRELFYNFLATSTPGLLNKMSFKRKKKNRIQSCTLKDRDSFRELGCEVISLCKHHGSAYTT